MIFTVIFFNPKTILAFDTNIIRHPVFKILIVYLIISILSLFNAINFREGLFDVSKTMAVLILIASLGIIFRNKHDWSYILPIFVTFAGLIACSIGFYQFFEKVLPDMSLKLPDGRPIIYAVTGLMAHKNQFSISLFMMLPFIVYGIYIYKDWKRWISALSFVLLLILILLLQTRAIWLGIIISSFFSAIVFVFTAKHFNLARKTRMFILLGFFLVLAFSSVAIVFGGSNNYITRLKSIVDPESKDNKYRLIIWQASVKMAYDHPVAGVGAGNWQFNLPPYIKGKGFAKDQLNWIRPHNDFLWVLTEKGIPGLILFLSFFVILYIRALNIIQRSENQNNKVFSLLLIFGLTGYLVDSFFDFPYERINQQVYMALFVASILALGSPLRKGKIPSGWIFRFISIPAIASLLFVVVFAFQAYNLETHIRNARTGILEGNWNKVLSEGKNAQYFLRNLDAEAVPVDWFIGLAYFKLNNVQSAITHYKIAGKNNPTSVTVLNNLGQAYFKIKDYENAEASFQDALNILPDYREALFNLSSLYYTVGQYRNALNVLLRIKDKNDPEIMARIKFLKETLRGRQQK